MKSFIIPSILWGYVLSVVIARTFWAQIYNKLVAAFDLSPDQAWILPISINLLAACIGLPQVARYIVSLRRRDPIPHFRHVASALCILAMALIFRASAGVTVHSSKHLATAANEWISQTRTDLFAAGTIVDGWYSNKLVGVQLELPKNWYPQTRNSIRRAQHGGAQALAGNDKQEAEELAREHPGHHALLAVIRYPAARPGVNPTLALRAYEKRVFAAAGIGSLETYVHGLAAVTEPFYLQSGPSRVPIGNSTGYFLQCEVRSPGSTTQKRVYVTETESLYILATATAKEDEDMATMEQAIATLRLERSTKTKY